MKIFIGLTISVVSLLGGFYLMGGDVFILWNPKEIALISLCAFASFFMSSDKAMVKYIAYDFKSSLSGGRYNKGAMLDMLVASYALLVRHRREGGAVFEGVISDPDGSNMMGDSVFFAKNLHLRGLFIDYLRLFIMDSTRGPDYIASMHSEFHSYQHDKRAGPALMGVTSEATPGLGIVVAVLGIIRALGAIDGPMSVLGHMIAEALVGNMFGVWVCYSALSPMAANLGRHAELDIMVRETLITILAAHLQGVSPIIAVELGRKVINEAVRPDFADLEAATIGGARN